MCTDCAVNNLKQALNWSDLDMFKQCPVFDSGLELQDSKIQEICCKADRLDIMEKYVALQALKEQEARGEYLTPDDQEINRK